MIVKRWGKYRALEDFADVKKDDVIDVTGVTEGPHEIMWACNGRISDWHDWDVPVIGFQSSVIPRQGLPRVVGSRWSCVGSASPAGPVCRREYCTSWNFKTTVKYHRTVLRMSSSIAFAGTFVELAVSFEYQMIEYL